MKTDIYRFNKSSFDISEFLSSAAKVAAYNKLNEKQELRLTLLTEELAEMIPNLLMFGDGEFYIENNGNNYKICIKVDAYENLDIEKREQLFSVSKSGKNAAAVGIKNKILIAAETMLANYETADAVMNFPADASYNFYSMGMDVDPLNYANLWTLDNYRDGVKDDSEAWDELEKSVIAKLADDVTVGIIKGTVEIIVKKSF